MRLPIRPAVLAMLVALGGCQREESPAPAVTLSFAAGDTRIDLPFGERQVMNSRRAVPRIDVPDAEVVSSVTA